MECAARPAWSASYWIEAADNYVQLHASGAAHLAHGTLAKLESAWLDW